MRGNTLRLRLTRSEVRKLTETGVVEESVDLTPNPLVYVMRAAKDCSEIQVSFLNGAISVSVPEALAAEWAAGDSVGMEGTFRGVSVLVEKDWSCAHGTESTNKDAFPRTTL
jgi:hypothetical protein